MKPLESLSYEQAMAELEDIVDQLESGALSLDETMSLHQRGRGLAERCQSLLDAADLKVQQLVEKVDGQQDIVPFSVDEG